jgi:hypothetical protein
MKNPFAFYYVSKVKFIKGLAEVNELETILEVIEDKDITYDLAELEKLKGKTEEVKPKRKSKKNEE